MKAQALELQHNVSSTLIMSYMALCAALIAVCSWITVPFTIPFTMQTFAVFVTAGLLGIKWGTCSVLVYILLGLVGLPVFSGFKGGAGVLFGVTGGYIIGFIFTALVIGAVLHIFGRKPWIMFIAMLLGMIFCYGFGTVWYMMLYTRNTGSIGVLTALQACVFPYIAPDIAKMLLAILVIRRVSPLIFKAGQH